ncbi:MAG: DUF6785 family protein [Candidatus Zipacnadales bacterium]
MDRATRHPLRPSTAAIALGLAVAVAAGGAFSALVRYDLVGFGHLPRAAVFGVFLLIVANLLAMKVLRRRLLSTAQLCFVYIAVLVMAGFPGQQLVTYLYLGFISSQHYATPENKYEQTFFDYIQPWMVPSKDPDHPVIAWAFEGLPAGASIPWQPWIKPLLWWTPYLLALLMLQACLASAFRKRWADDEHMLFPLARVPVELMTYSDPRDFIPGVCRTWFFFIAFMVPVYFFSKNALHYYWPVIPYTELNKTWEVLFTSRPWTQLNWFPHYYYFEMMGVTYLIADDIGGSLWFFWVLRRLIMVVRDALGYTEMQEYFRMQGVGGYTLIAGAYLWMARHRLREIVQKALVDSPEIDDSNEPLSYRMVFFGFLGSLVVICLWGWAAGAAMWATLALMTAWMISLIVLSRLVAESGVFAVWSPLSAPQDLVVRVIGSRTLGPQNITALGYMGWKIQDTASATMANIFQGYKIADLADLRPRTVFWLMAVSLGLSLMASHPTAIYAIYSHSVPGLGWWPRSAGASLPQSISTLIVAERDLVGYHYWQMGLGAGIVLLLHLLRQRFVWWPFHPVGYAAIMGPQFMGDRYGFSIFLGWIIKKAVKHFGGHRVYEAFRPAAIGIIVGNAVVLLFWTIVHYFRPISGVLIIE